MKKITNSIKLNNRVAIVTGAAGHIGLVICETLMELGANVSVVDLSLESCKKRSRELNFKGFPGKSIPIAADLLNEKETRRAVKDTVKQFGRIDIVVHCAGFVGTTKYPGWVVPFEKQTLDAWDAAMRVNLSSAFIITQEAKPFLDKSKHASVIFISSIHGIIGPDMSLYEGTKMGNPAAYGVSKAGLNHLTRYLATVLAPYIRVNSIIPGGIWRNQLESFHERYKDRTPMKRMGTEDDLKGAIAYLASDISSYTTGINLIVDGGYTAW